jgi:hypothetical protein
MMHGCLFTGGIFSMLRDFGSYHRLLINLTLFRNKHDYPISLTNQSICLPFFVVRKVMKDDKSVRYESIA